MLFEKSNSTRFNIGDTVKIHSTGQIGKIIKYDNGMYTIKVPNGTVICEGKLLERKEILLG